MIYGAIGPQWPTWCRGRLRYIGPRFEFLRALAGRAEDIVNKLVDPASSYMLVSENKPSMSKHIRSNVDIANGSLNRV